MPARSAIPLRERKFAQTKLKLARAAVERLETQSLDGLSVAALCEAAEVSEATFFNYFPRKSDLLNYVSQLWAVEIGWHVRAAGLRGIAGVSGAFEQAARQIQRHPGTMGEIIGQQARLRERSTPGELTRAERLLGFPELEGIEDVPAGGLDSILVANVDYAVESGELPPNTHRATVLVALVSIFYGVPLALRLVNPGGIAHMYRQQLTLLWAGVRAAAGRNG
ncbi:MAG TPA: helix-turn-helix domain-containing protein [Gammaproteobacteria bacterium]|nr:helix-turn-helix domain-containing protein [Gammaproteobacteria bacterium]